MQKTINKQQTTEQVVDLPTPFEPPLVDKPTKQLIIEILNANKKTLLEDFTTSDKDNTINDDEKKM